MVCIVHLEKNLIATPIKDYDIFKKWYNKVRQPLTFTDNELGQPLLP